MMEQYLLRTDWQIQAFRSRYAKFIRNNHDRFLEWFMKLPLYEWVRMPFPDQKLEAGIGLLCLLYIDGEINLCVDRTVSYVQRQASTEEEHLEWAKKNFKHPKNIQL